jgi:hypothetical protein
VNDFRTVDYEGLTTLNISATQELGKLYKQQQATITGLTAKLEAVINELEQLKKNFNNKLNP